MGRLGQGKGGLAPEEETGIDFKTERGKVHTGKGAIIGQFLVEGAQVKGNVSSEFTDVVVAAERDATDRVNRNRVPRQYHKAVKAYFSNVQRSMGKRDRRSGKEAAGSDQGGESEPANPANKDPSSDGGD